MLENKKRILSKLLILVIIVCSIICNFKQVSYATNESNKTWDISREKDGSVIATLDKAYTLTISGKGEMEDYSDFRETPWSGNRSSVKKIIIEEGVTNIGDYAFYDVGDVIIDVEIANSVTSIGDYAFYLSSGLNKIYIPSGVKDIGEFAFGGCVILGYIKVDSNNTMYSDENGVLYSKDKTEIIKYPVYRQETEYILPSSVTNISDNAFESCFNLKSISVPSSVTTIEENAFIGCQMLEKIKVDNNNTKYSDVNGVLYSKDKTKIIRYPEGKKETEYKILNGVQSIEVNSFYNCTNLKSIEIPSGVATIEDGAFLNCERLENIKFSNTVKSIGESAFGFCKRLKSIQLSEELTNIGNFAFNGCEKLENINIPGSVKKIGYGIFSDCESLTNLNVDRANTMFMDNDGILYSKDKKEILIYPAGKTETEFTVPKGVTNIADYAFTFSQNLTSVKIPNSVKNIGNYAFWNCCFLTNIEISNKVEKIGEGAFYECVRLTDINIPNGVTSIEKHTFASCYQLKNVTIPESIISIGEEAFSTCQNLEKITIPKNVVEIEKDAFDGWYLRMISCYPETEAERYAQENDITYQLISLDSMQDDITTQGDETNAWIVYIGIGILIIVLVTIGIIVYKKHNYYKI